jgi:A1 cistron-splicing factor AAR2
MVLIQESENVGVFLCLGTPQGTEFGIDYYSYTVSDQFVGWHEIPFGVHYFYYSITSNALPSAPGAPRISMFCAFDENCLYHVWRYNRDIEVFEIVPRDSDLYNETVAKYEQGQYTKQIGPYPFDHYEQWKSLANFITPKIVESLQPVGRFIYSTLSTEEEKLLQKHQMDVDPDHKFSSASTTTGRVFYKHIARKLKRKGATPQELTKLNFDKSALLEQLLKEYQQEHPDFNSEQFLLGELQFAFICFLIGQCQDGLDQWKNIIELLCSCDEAINEHPQLFVEFINVLYNQLKNIPKDFFTDELSERNFLTKTLTGFFSIVSDSSTHEKVRERAQQLRTFLENEFHWIIEEDDFEDAPYIVEE